MRRLARPRADPVEQPYISSVPTRHGRHLPQDSSRQKSMKNLATSTMQAVSSMTIMPPEPMIEPALGQGLVVDRHVKQLLGYAATRRATRLDRLEPAALRQPPPMSNTIWRRVRPIGTSISPVLTTAPVRANTFVPLSAPCRSSSAIARPAVMTAGMLANVSTLFMSVGSPTGPTRPGTAGAAWGCPSPPVSRR